MSWREEAARLEALARLQLFFIGGAPRSGTTWLQQMMHAHPEICCRGEGLFLHHLAVPLEAAMQQRGVVIDGKNRELFGHTGGFPLPDPGDTEQLVGTAVLQALARCAPGPGCRALGEKTPENVFFFPRLLALFPDARFIAIARDPRDVLSSAWHFFGRRGGGTADQFVDAALPSMCSGAEAMVRFSADQPERCRLVTYESLRVDPAPVLATLFGLLGVADDAAVVAQVIAATAFTAATGGRAAGVIRDGAFHRSGVVGGWRDTLSAPVADRIVAALGAVYAAIGVKLA